MPTAQSIPVTPVRYDISVRATERARRVTPGGAQTRSKRPEAFPEGLYPAYLSHGEGAHVWDVDGHEYVDLICALGAVSLGYRHPRVDEAVKQQLRDGIAFSLPTRWEAAVAERLVDVVPCARPTGQVRFTKTGSEACAGALRIARRATGRAVCVVVGYHGWHDTVMAHGDAWPGVPEHAAVFRVPYGDLEQLRVYVTRDNVAAVMLEPTRDTPPPLGYLRAVVDLCHVYGAVAIFDESVTGFRWARAGGQEYFGVTPDLAVFGKALGNGMPIAAIVGPRALMQEADGISGTHGGEALSLAAAHAVLDVYADGRPVARQWEDGRLIEGWCRELGIPVSGYPVHLKITYPPAAMRRFLVTAAAGGLLLHPAGFNVPAVLTPADRAVIRHALAQGAQCAAEDGLNA